MQLKPTVHNAKQMEKYELQVKLWDVITKLTYNIAKLQRPVEAT